MGSSTEASLQDDVVQWFSDPAARQDPYDFFDRLREQEPVHYNETLAAWVLTRYDDADQMLRRSPVLRNPAGADTSYMYGEDGELTPTWRLNVGTHFWHDGEELARIRRLVSQTMGARQIRTWRGEISAMLDEEMERLLASGKEADLIADFVYELPMRMICKVFGVPLSDHENYRIWTEDWFAASQRIADPDVQARGDAAAIAFEQHVGELADHRREHPDDSMLSNLIRARDEGDKLRDDELIAMTVSMLGAGHETTGSFVGNAAYNLLRHPDQLALVREDPELLTEAVEEALRYEGSAMLAPRYAFEDFELHGQQIASGDTIITIMQATGRSPGTYEDPNRFWVQRPDKRHLQFSLGPHFCCGAQLARLESELMVQAIATRFDGLELTTDEVTWKPMLGIRGLTSLPVRWN